MLLNLSLLNALPYWKHPIYCSLFTNISIELTSDTTCNLILLSVQHSDPKSI